MRLYVLHSVETMYYSNRNAALGQMVKDVVNNGKNASMFVYEHGDEKRDPMKAIEHIRAEFLRIKCAIEKNRWTTKEVCTNPGWLFGELEFQDLK